MIMMRTALIVCLIAGTLLHSFSAHAQKRGPKSGERGPLAKTLDITSRGGGFHNRSNMGSAFENRGKLYPRQVAFGPTFEWPIGSQHEYVYRANPYVGIPGNMIQGRFTKNEEWEAAAGYNNIDSAKVAMSDKPYTWPASGWPVRKPNGEPLFVSNQDSYCVYNDSTNSKGVLGIQINQTGYAFGGKAIRDMVIYGFDIVNRSQNTYDSLYFGMYLDADIGGSDNAVDYGNDHLAFDKSLERVTYYDDGTSTQWNGPSGRFGFIMLRTPEVNGTQMGITDLHYLVYNDDIDIDSVEYGIFSSAPSLAASPVGSKYFHPGANGPNLHYDDPATIGPGGIDLVSNIGSGPYTLAPGDTLHFITAFVAAIDAAQMDRITTNAWSLYRANFATAQPPAAPTVGIISGDGRATLIWDNAAESARDVLTQLANFQGYRVYKSVDRGLHWDQIDRNVNPAAGADPVPLAEFDRSSALQHSYVDSTLTNGFEYWYSVTAYSALEDGTVLESSLGFSSEEKNIGIAHPQSSAVGRLPAQVSGITHTGTANATLTASQLDIPGAGGKQYTVGFVPTYTIAKGNLKSIIEVVEIAGAAAEGSTYALVFGSASTFVVRNLTTSKTIVPSGVYSSGIPITFGGLQVVLTDTASSPDDQPEAGDSILIQPGVIVTTGGIAVLDLQPLWYSSQFVTSDGVVFSIVRNDALRSSLVSYSDVFTFTTIAAHVQTNVSYSDLGDIKVVPNPYLIGSMYEQEYGTLRREPIRQLKFNHLPTRCTITIFTMAGDKIKVIQHDGITGTETWDLRTDGNRVIAGGMYLYLVKTDTAEKLGRFAVIK
jgi:hypothetical protein